MNLFLIFTIIAIIPSYSTAEESRLQTNHVTFADPSSIEGKSAMTVLSPPAILSNNVTSSAPSTSPPADPSDHTGSEWSKMVIGYTMLSVAALIVNWSLWVFRKELLDGCKKGCDRRSSGDDQEGILNDIIFDPDEEQSDNLSQSLLSDSA